MSLAGFQNSVYKQIGLVVDMIRKWSFLGSVESKYWMGTLYNLIIFANLVVRLYANETHYSLL